MSSPTIGFFCPACSRYAVHPSPRARSELACGACARGIPFDPSPSVAAFGPVDVCPVCANRQFYTRKDFPQQVGCALLSATILVSTVGFAIWGALGSVAVLAVASLIDFVLYYRLPLVSVCYRCHAEFRGFPSHPAHAPFDLNRAEEYEQGR